MFVKPAPRSDDPSKVRMVPDPDKRGMPGEILPEGGARVEGNATYWFRRLEDGDVTLAEPPADSAPPATPTTPKKKG